MAENMDQAVDTVIVKDYCRLCANTAEKMVSIYDEEGADHIMLEKKIKTHFPFINISENDSLPNRICFGCASNVIAWDEFYECTSDADQKLRSMFEETPHDSSKNVPYNDIGIYVPVKDFIRGSIEYEDLSEVNIFNKNTISDKTLNELIKIPSTSKTAILNHENESYIIEEEEKPTILREISDLFNEKVGDNNPENNIMCLNAAGINVLMNGHRLKDMPTTENDECGREMFPKSDYLVNDNEYESIRIASVLPRNDDDQHHQGHSNSSTVISGSMSNGCRNFRIAVTDDGEAGNVSLKAITVDRSLLVDNECNDDKDKDVENVDNQMSMRVNQLYTNLLSAELIEMSSNNDQDPNMCHICATVFKTRYNLLRHYRKQHPEFKMHECDLCRISFQSIEEFKNHLEEKHSKEGTVLHSLDANQVRFACDVCGNMYKNKSSVMNHLMTHSAKKNVHCTQCDFSCYTKQQLSVHQNKHNKRFGCEICYKPFAQKSQLDVHINAVHYNQRPHICTLCKKSFKTKGSHDAHMIVHTDTRNYQCPHCPKKCRKRYDLTLHIRTHTGEKPFKCVICGRGFVQRCDTRKHEMIHYKQSKV